MLLLIDNYDSFTHNLARYFRELGQTVEVIRNDQINCQQIEALSPEYLVFSPGPCTPDDAGITLEAVKKFYGSIPMLGVCLGYQAIAQVAGATISRAKRIRHGKTSKVEHNGHQMFRGIPSEFDATRYHSLVVVPETLSDDFLKTAWCHEDGVSELMAFSHKTLPVSGVQFHPESHLTQFGHEILQNFLQQ